LSYISKNAGSLERSSIRKIFELQMKHKNVIPFSIGEPDFDTPPNIVEACIKALREGKTRYAPNGGIMDLKVAYAEKLKRTHGVEYDPVTEILIASSCMDALRIASQATLEEGDELLMTEPVWSNHPNHPAMVGAKAVLVPVTEEDGFMYNVKTLDKYLTNKTKALLLNSPSNPTGGVISKKALEELCDFCKKHDLLIFSDEVYQDILYDGQKFYSAAMIEGMKDRVIICDSLSKTYAMTGWRVGFMAGPPEIMNAVNRIHENTICSVNTFVQYGALEAINGMQEYAQQMIAEYEVRRNLVYEGINAIEGLSCIKPKGAFYAFVNIKETGMTSEEFAFGLLEKKQVALVPGNGFGEAGEGYVRISYATSQDNIKEGIKRIEEFIKGT